MMSTLPPWKPKNAATEVTEVIAEPCDCLTQAARAHQNVQHVRLDKALGRRTFRCRGLEKTFGNGMVKVTDKYDPRCCELIAVADGKHLDDCAHHNPEGK